jgi:predicted MPP superfamily phosphohydrolase
MKVAADRSQAFALSDMRDWRAPVIRERRRFTDIMDEEIDDERKVSYNSIASNNLFSFDILGSHCQIRQR